MFPKPVAGQVIRYSYLWRSEYTRGQEEGAKDRPCAVILAVTDYQGRQIVTVLPITHTPPLVSDSCSAIEIPASTKRRLGLDDVPSWIVVSEANRFTWPGPDIRPARRDDGSSAIYGELPGHLLVQVRDAFLQAAEKHAGMLVPRTE